MVVAIPEIPVTYKVNRPDENCDKTPVNAPNNRSTTSVSLTLVGEQVISDHLDDKSDIQNNTIFCESIFQLFYQKLIICIIIKSGIAVNIFKGQYICFLTILKCQGFPQTHLISIFQKFR